jgi:CHAD domain-containing protein
MLETERKYDVDESTQLPDLSALGTTELSDPITLRAIYYDTADWSLARRLTVLRRRTGGADEGWHIKIPAGDSRTEYQMKATEAESDSTPPAPLLEVIRSIIRSKPLSEVARLTTERTIVTVLDNEGGALIEIADDRVSATDIHTGILRIWREWEAELREAAPTDPQSRSELLNQVEEILTAAGAAPPISASKLARAIGRTSLGSDMGAGAPAEIADGELSKTSPALSVAVAVVGDLVETLVQADPRARADEPDAVHSMRTTVRRLRSLLATFRGVFDSTVTDEIRTRLGLLGDVLGAARDAEVRRLRGTALLSATDQAEPSDSAEPSVETNDVDLRRRLVDDTMGEYHARLADVNGYLNSAEYFELLDDLDALVARPPLGQDALLPAGPTISVALAAQSRRTLRRLKKADPANLDQLHAARKAARKLRYSAEAVSGKPVPLFKKKKRALAAAAEDLHDLLGEHRDAILFGENLHTLEREAQESGENTAGYEVLSAREAKNASAAIGKTGSATKSLSKAAQR